MNDKKLIIHIQDDTPYDVALGCVNGVIQMGRVSNFGKSYCFISTFESGTIVYAIRNKNSDTFYVMKESLAKKETL